MSRPFLAFFNHCFFFQQHSDEDFDQEEEGHNNIAKVNNQPAGQIHWRFNWNTKLICVLPPALAQKSSILSYDDDEEEEEDDDEEEDSDIFGESDRDDEDDDATVSLFQLLSCGL